MANALHAAMLCRSPQGVQVAAHRHHQHELVLVLEGDLTVSIMGLNQAGRPGDVMVMPARLAHDQRCQGPWRTLCVLFSGEMAMVPEVIATGGDVLVSTWMEQLRLLAGDVDAPATGHALLEALLLRLAEHRQRASHDQDLHPAVVLAQAHILAHLDAPLHVGDLVRRSGLSHSHLGALFRTRHGCSPLQWHLRQRLQRARALLANPYASVTQVARSLGFPDLNYFVRRFRAMHGVPPGAWRRHER